MKAIVTQHVNRAKIQSKYIVLAIMFFTILGWLAPYLYYQYIDKTIYYDIQRVTTDKKIYNYCEPLVLKVQRTSKIETTAVVNIRLLKKNDGGIVYDYKEITVPISIGDKTFEDATFEIPCKTIPVGEYYYDGVVNYKVDRVTRQEGFQSETFMIKGDINATNQQSRQGDITASPAIF